VVSLGYLSLACFILTKFILFGGGNLEKIISVGIDIGTSTTQVIFSHITIENLASAYSVPQIDIIDKNVFYKSEIYFTPLISETEIDGQEIKKIIESEFKKANVAKKDISTGAVIITGETARKKNASLISEQLSDLAGDFVVATAGPDLESIIAGKGAGADKLSEKLNKLVINFDIGGGTTNIALFESGQVIDTACLDVGGRLIQLDEQNRLQYISKKIKKLAADLNLNLEIGKKVENSELEIIAEKMASVLSEVLKAGEKSSDYNYLITNHDLSKNYAINHVSFSGGVADYINNDHSGDLYKYNDLGIILAQKIRESSLYKDHQVYQAEETIRATVVGAGSHTTDISGSTITYTDNIFPLKNIPIIKITPEEEKLSKEELVKVIKKKLDWYDLDFEAQTVAVAMKGKENFNFAEITELAEAIIAGMEKIIKLDFPLIVILENDAAKVLGQTINRLSKEPKAVVSLDGIKVDNGDYIDIGKPLARGKVLPVIIKTLIFGK